MSILISGTLAYDYIMDFPDSFKNHILPDHIHMLNVSFMVQKLQKNIGGTGGNIAYTMKLLLGDPIIVGALGSDDEEYRSYLDAQQIKTTHISISKNVLTASAYITTDKDDNQITAFYPGPSSEAVKLHIQDVKEKLDLIIIGPTDKSVMIQHSKEAYEQKIPIVFDPGQAVIAFSEQELAMLVGQAKIVIGNDYEMKIIEDRTGWNSEQLLDHAEIVITTLGERGSLIRTKDEYLTIEPCPPTSVEDPTGAGDSYRAGFFTAYVNGHNLKTCGQVGSVCATYAVEHYGTQKHIFTKAEFVKRYEETYGETVELIETSQN